MKPPSRLRSRYSGLSLLSVAISVPIYLSLRAGRNDLAKPDAGTPNVPSGLLAIVAGILRRPLIPLTHLEAASGAAAVSSLWGEFFLLKALLVFDGGSALCGTSHRKGAARGARGREGHGSSEHATQQRRQLLPPLISSLLVSLMGGALSITGGVLLLMLEHMPDTPSRVLYCCLALACVFIGASCTHGLGGHLAHCAGAAGSAGAAVLRASTGGASRPGSPRAGGAGRSSSGGSAFISGSAAWGPGDEGSAVEAGDAVEGPSWRFFQPFQGGSVFVATQAIGWTLFSGSVVVVLLLAKELVAGVGYCLRCWALTAGALMTATQLVLGVSVLTFQHRRQARQLLPRAGLVMPVVMMYLPLHISLASMAALFALLPTRTAAGVLLAVLPPYFAATLRGHPAHTGRRRWKWLVSWFSRNVEDSLAWWAGQLTVIRDFPGTAHQAADAAEAAAAAEAEAEVRASRSSSSDEATADAGAAGAAGGAAGAGADVGDGGGRRYVLGFHPHGLYPTGAGFLPLMPSVHAAFPGTTIVTLTASIVHYAPGLRDIAAWAGFRQVTRATFRRALHETGAVLLCPGGQAELVYADKAFPPRRGVAAAATAAAKAPAPTPTPSIAADAADDAAATTAARGAPASTPSAPEAFAAAEGSGAGDSSEGDDCARAERQRQQHQLVIYAGHQGFVRLALEEGAWLVPVLALGETLQVGGESSAPSPAGGAHHVEVPREVVDAYHAAFYSALASLWARHHHLHPVLRHAELVFEWGRHGPPDGFSHGQAPPGATQLR
ncbi:hypothetical protein GPECTOR_78g93 [Gonium pectorale]|uniref:Diacylglycerol O-acyltransferase n=1 Tax=Gonium pectorale TaxID=33097 RepID=A0A150G319_GONPE|nr:hypothetical protein GPECTOR_78g93 [Gonium pectorale]|eukprot:KXZ43905.1 hypothetical protein GPECTOR_78g93 [Gonium pectorale]